MAKLFDNSKSSSLIGLPSKFRLIRHKPIFDLEPVELWRLGLIIRRPMIGQLESTKIEAEARFVEYFKAEINDSSISRNRKGFALVTEIAAGRANSPEDSAIRLQQGETRVALIDKKQASGQRHKGRRCAVG